MSAVQLAVTLSPALSPSSLSAPHLIHTGQVGELADVQLFSVPKETWDVHGEEIVERLKGTGGVLRVDIVEGAKRRVKRDDQ